MPSLPGAFLVFMFLIMARISSLLIPLTPCVVFGLVLRPRAVACIFRGTHWAGIDFLLCLRMLRFSPRLPQLLHWLSVVMVFFFVLDSL